MERTERIVDMAVGASIGISLSAIVCVLAFPLVVHFAAASVADDFRSLSLLQGLYARDGLPRLDALEQRVDRLEQGAER